MGKTLSTTEAAAAGGARAEQALQPERITAFLVGMNSRPAVLQMQRALNEHRGEPLTAVLPGVTLAELWRLVGVADRALRAVAACVVLAGLLGMVATLLTGLNERRREMAVLRAVGARPAHVFGLLALAVFLGCFGMPRSAPLVGGMTLALMTLPTIIISCRSSIRAVSPGVRQGAMALGASPVQVVFHQVLPAALPGTLTGTIIGMAQALGETAPLLMIGMVAFIASVPATPMDSSAALPVQIYLWAESAERGFVEKTAAAIIVIMSFLVLMNILAVIIRSRTQTKVE